MDFKAAAATTTSSASASSHYQGFMADPALLEFSLQDMIDSDIKMEPDGFSSCDTASSGTMGSLELLNDFDFNLDGGLLGSGHDWSSDLGFLDANSELYTTSSGTSDFGASAGSGLHHEDMIAGSTALMVNPNSVMPLHRSNSAPQQQQQQHVQLQSQPQQQNSQQQYQFVVKHQISNSAIPITFVTHQPLSSGSHQQQHQVQISGISGLANRHGAIKTLRILPPLASPSHQDATLPGTPTSKRKPVSGSHKSVAATGGGGGGKDGGSISGGFPKPAYSYSCLITLALKNSRTGSMSVSEIYGFMCEHFPYFKTAPSGWKNAVRHNLSLNKSFEKRFKPSSNGNARKGCLWALNPAKVAKMDEEVAKGARKDRPGIEKGMIKPENLDALQRGEMVKDYGGGNASAGADSEDDEDPKSPTSVSSQDSAGGYLDRAGSLDSASGSEAVEIELFDVEKFSAMSDTLNLQTPLNGGGLVFEDFELSNSSFHHANVSVPQQILHR